MCCGTNMKELREAIWERPKCWEKLKERFYWPGHVRDVKNWCQSCSACAQQKHPTPRNKAKVQTVRVGYPMQMVATDILGPFPESVFGNLYILVATDYFTRLAEAYPIPDQKATTVNKKLTNEMFLRFSPPEQLHCDQCLQFESRLLAKVCKLLHIHKSRTIQCITPNQMDWQSVGTAHFWGFWLPV